MSTLLLKVRCLPGSFRLAIAAFIPALATGIALLFPGRSSLIAAMVYLLGVIASALIDRMRGGLVASVLSFLGLNFFFTPPTGVFSVERVEDVVALFAFLFTASITALLLGEVLSEHERAERREADVREAEMSAEQNRHRAALYSSVTHDLKTPLASIKAAATGLLEEGVAHDPAQKRDLLLTISEESDHLDRLIQNILDVSRLRSGGLVPSPTEVHVEDVVQNVVARAARRAPGRKFAVDIDPDTPAVRADITQMDQVISNLVENALKFTPDDAPIEIAVGPLDAYVQVAVVDHGPGIAKDLRSKVFEEGFSLRVGGTSGGTGLGLAIARAIVDAHGGEIEAAETRGGGATVRFRVPAEIAGAMQ